MYFVPKENMKFEPRRIKMSLHCHFISESVYRHSISLLCTLLQISWTHHPALAYSLTESRKP